MVPKAPSINDVIAKSFDNQALEEQVLKPLSRQYTTEYTVGSDNGSPEVLRDMRLNSRGSSSPPITVRSKNASGISAVKDEQ